jgi:hypothetical protein
MIFEILLLAAASTVRPSSLAAVYAILSHSAPRRLMTAYVIAGLAFTVAFGIIVVGAFHGIHLSAGTERTKAIAEVVGGVVLLLFGAVILRRPARGTPADDAPTPLVGWQQRLERHLTVPAAAAAGPLTHIPGLFYIVALDIIVAHNPLIPGGVIAVLVYNAIWFALPILAMAMCVVHPETARDAVVSVQRWTSLHSRTILLATTFVAGAALTIRGVLAL